MEIPKSIRSHVPVFCHESIYGTCRTPLFRGHGYEVNGQCFCPECYNKKRMILNDNFSKR